jgi:hypothetical protein
MPIAATSEIQADTASRGTVTCGRTRSTDLGDAAGQRHPAERHQESAA